MNRQLCVVIACGGTGGHLFPGIAVAEQLRAMGLRPVLLISRKDVDAEASKKYGDLEFHTVQAIAKPPIFSLKTPGFLWNLARTYFRCKRILRREKADVVLGMGGFTSLPPVRAGHMLGLRTYVHDSNALPGRSNRMTARWCTKILLGMAEAGRYFPGKESVVVGTPVREEMRRLPSVSEARRQLDLPDEATVVLVTGGSQGARHLNSLLVEAARQDAGVHYLIIAGKQDCDRVRALAGDAPNIKVLGFCSDMPAAYAAADGVIARAGASTLTELSTVGKACLLIPFPYAADDHQTCNARVFVSRGAAVMCRQSELTPDKVWEFVHGVVMEPQVRAKMEEAMRRMARPCAAEDIARAIVGE